MSQTLYQNIADSLYHAYRTHTQIDQISNVHPELTAEDAYRIQEINLARAEKAGNRVSGYKVGLSAAELMRSMHVSEPDYGRLYDKTQIPENGTADFDAMFQPKIEGEVAFVMAADIESPVTADEVLQSVDYICAAFEMPQTRTADWKNKIADTVSDNSSAGAYMLSSYHVSPQNVDFAAIGVRLTRNGTPLAEGTADVVMGNPINTVTWLANKLIAHGYKLKKGDAVLSGALCGAHLVSKGDLIEADFDLLGTLRVRFL